MRACPNRRDASIAPWSTWTPTRVGTPTILPCDEATKLTRGRRDVLAAFTTSLALMRSPSGARAADDTSAACSSCEGPVDGTLGRCEGFGKTTADRASTTDRLTSRRRGSSRAPRARRCGPSRTPSSPPAGASRASLAVTATATPAHPTQLALTTTQLADITSAASSAGTIRSCSSSSSTNPMRCARCGERR